MTYRAKAVLGTAVGFVVLAALVTVYVLCWMAKPAEALGTGGVRTDWVFDGGFSKLVSSGALHDFLATTPPD